MLWRKGYVTERITDFCADWGDAVDAAGSLPSFIPVAAIGFFESEQLTDVELWCRLLQADFPNQSDWVLLNLGVPEEELEMALPPSLLKRVYASCPVNWPFGREFAWRPGLVMVGPPTEDAWEEFSSGLFALED